MQYKAEFEEEWIIVYAMIQKHPEFFTGADINENKSQLYQLFVRAYTSVVTRCFGWGIPCTTMIPFADFINHHNVDSSYEFISSQFDPLVESDGVNAGYFTVSKKEVNYADLYNKPQAESEFPIQNNRSLNYIKLLNCRSECRNFDITMSKLQSS